MDFDINKPVIVLMHGSGLTHIVWSLHEQFLTTAGYSVLSVDLPGHGKQPWSIQYDKGCSNLDNQSLCLLANNACHW